MSSPYRNDIGALRDRKDSLEREIAQLKQERSRLEELRSREEELERELAAVAQRLGASHAKRALPTLDQLRVASPCSASWDEMRGDERVRFCTSCAKNVYNLSAMPREDAERLLQERVGKGAEGNELCVRFYQRADGTIMTADCPVGVKKKRRKQLALSVAGAGVMALAATTTVSRTTVVMGGMHMPPPDGADRVPPVMDESAPPTPPSPPPTAPTEIAPNAPRWTTGAAVAVPPPPEVKGTTPAVMGRRTR